MGLTGGSTAGTPWGKRGEAGVWGRSRDEFIAACCRAARALVLRRLDCSHVHGAWSREDGSRCDAAFGFIGAALFGRCGDCRDCWVLGCVCDRPGSLLDLDSRGGLQQWQGQETCGGCLKSVAKLPQVQPICVLATNSDNLGELPPAAGRGAVLHRHRATEAQTQVWLDKV
jgi:hypothetical protein